MNVSEVAKLAGVSAATVSRYFNNGYLSEEKRKAIQKVVEETGYRPSLQAQTLRTRKTKMIGVIVPKIASDSIGKVVEGILSVLNRIGYQMLLAVTQNNPAKELEYLTAFNGRQVDGVILAATIFTPEHKRLLQKLTVPAVIIGQRLDGYNCVFHDDYHAFYDMTKYILESGRTHPGYLSATQKDKAAGEERLRGFSDAVRDMGRQELAERFVTASFTVASGYEKTKELLEKYKDLDAIVCATDSMAAGAMQYLNESGISVPERILVSGQGDSNMSKVTSPPFLTIHYSYEKSGEIAVEMLMKNLEAKEQTRQEVKLGYYIVEAKEQ